MAASFDLPIAQGTTFNQSYQLKDLAGNNVNTSTVDAGPHQFEVRKDIADRDSAVLATGTMTLNSTGLLTLGLTVAQTRLIKDPTYRWHARAVEGATQWMAATGQFTGMTFEV